MGAGIAQAFAVAGLSVSIYDKDPEAPQKALTGIEKSLHKLASKQKLSEELAQESLARISTCHKMSELPKADLVIEAIVENLSVKQELFRELDGILPDKTVFLTNTSSLSVTDMANVTGESRRSRFAGMHFFNPVALMKLVEVIRTPFTSDETFSKVWNLAEACRKSPVEAKDTPGFLFNRLILPYLNEAIWAVAEGAGTVEDIDRAMLLGGNMPIGPLALADMVGLDVFLHALAAIRDETGDPKYRPCPLSRQMVRAGYLGKKSGQGFYDYRGAEKTVTDLSAFRF